MRAAGQPRALGVGFALQYGLMPLLGLLFSRLLALPPPLAAGLILLCSCPGGTASNLVTHLAGGSVALSVLMTTASTLAACVATPALTALLAGQLVPVDALGLARSAILLVLAPVLVGTALRTALPPSARATAATVAPAAASVISAGLTCSAFALSSGALLRAGGGGSAVGVALAVFLAHGTAFAAGLLVARRLARLDRPSSAAVSVESGMQNSVMAVSLAGAHFAGDPLVAFPGAVSAVLMNIMAGFVAGRLRAWVEAEATHAGEE